MNAQVQTQTVATRAAVLDGYAEMEELHRWASVSNIQQSRVLLPGLSDESLRLHAEALDG